MERNDARALHKFRPPPPHTNARRRVDQLLDPDVLDDDTRRMLLDEVMRPAQPPRVPQQEAVTPPRPTAPPLPPQQHNMPAPRRGSGQASLATRPHDDRAQQQPQHRNNSSGGGATSSSFPQQLRERVSSSSNNSRDKDIVAAMAARLAEVERLHAVYQSELHEMHGKYRALQDKYDSECREHAAATRALQALTSERDTLQRALAQQQQQRHAAPSPRRRGSKDDTTSALPATAAEPHSGSGNKDDGEGCPVDVALLTRNARLLSEHVGRKCIRAAGKQGGLHDRDVVHVTVYRNGIRVNDGAFRPYGWPLCDAFVLDLAEGYYPYEYKERYPDGFPIDVVDRSDVDCEAGLPREQQQQEQQQQQRQRQQAATRPSQGAHVHQLGEVVHDGDGGAGGTRSLAQLLARVPAQHVTASGQLVAVRAGVAEFVGASPRQDGARNSSNVAVRHHVTAVERRAASASDDATTGGVAALMCVLVRLPSGERVLLRTTPEQTVAEVRRELQLAAPELTSLSYELAEAVPFRCLSEHTHTLRQAQLTRSVALLVHRLPNR